MSWKFLDISILRDVDLFSTLSERALSEMIPLTTTVELTDGESLFREGDDGDAMYLILNGEVRVSKEIPGVGEEALAFLKKGAYLGEMALVGERSRRSAHATAQGIVQLARLDRTDFIKLIKNDSSVGVEILWSFATTLSERLRESNDKIAFFAMSSMFE